MLANQNNESSGVPYFEGDLTANTFTIDNNPINANQTYIISGNGNLEYGRQAYDTLDLSTFSVNNVIEYNILEPTGGGEVVRFPEGDRILDSLTLSNGNKILFEGIDRLVFSDRIVDLTITPNDPSYNLQWNLHTIGVQNAWRFTTGSDAVLVGVQDTGLGIFNSQIHPDLRLNYYFEDNIADDFFNNNRGVNFGLTNDSHGTGVQGIIAANGNNGVGIAGINWGSEVSQIDVLDANQGDRNFILATQAKIDIARENNQKLVINFSLGEGTFDELGVSALELNTVIVSNPDVLFVIAAGNNGHLGISGLDSPAVLAKYYDNVIAVGASWGDTDANGNLVVPGTRIEYPGVWGSQYGQGLTITAPSEVLTTDALRNGDFTYDPLFNGTSAAAPHVSGVASLIWSANPNLTAFEVKDIIASTAYDLGVEGYDIEYGYGLIDADAGVRQAIAAGRENNATAIQEEFNRRLREMLDDFQSRFPDADLEEIYTRYGLTFETPGANFPFASNIESDRNFDPLTGANNDFSVDVLGIDKKIELGEANVASNSFIEELDNNYFGLNDAEILGDRELDLVVATTNEFFGKDAGDSNNLFEPPQEIM